MSPWAHDFVNGEHVVMKNGARGIVIVVLKPYERPEGHLPSGCRWAHGTSGEGRPHASYVVLADGMCYWPRRGTLTPVQPTLPIPMPVFHPHPVTVDAPQPPNPSWRPLLWWVIATAVILLTFFGGIAWAVSGGGK
jgi:hypothetical protein